MYFFVKRDCMNIKLMQMSPPIRGIARHLENLACFNLGMPPIFLKIESIVAHILG